VARKRANEQPTVTEQLRRFLRETGKTTYRLGKDSGCKPEQIGRFLSGERDITGKTMDRLCRALGLHLTRLPEGTKTKERE
jgi:plasmid maintenance system antidote protein VapI